MAAIPPQDSAIGPTPAGKPLWLRRLLGAALALGACLAVVSGTSLVTLFDVVRTWALSKGYLSAPQAELSRWIQIVSLLVLPVALLAVALVRARRGPSGPRRAVVLPLGAALLLLILLAASEGPVIDWVYQAQTGLNPGPSVAPSSPFLWSTLVPSVWQGLVTGLTLIILVRMVAPRLLPSRPVPGAAHGALVGALGGLVTAVYVQLYPLVLFSLEAVRFARIGETDCVSGFGVGCYPGQLWQMASVVVLPTTVGAALGGGVGALLIPELRAATSAAAPPGSGRVRAGDRPGRRLTRYASLTACAVIGVLCALLTRFAIDHAGGSRPLLALPFEGLLLPLLVLLLPAALGALVAARTRLASALGPASARGLLLAIALLGGVGALGVPLSLLVVQPVIEEAPTAAMAVEAICLGAALAATMMAAAAEPTWRIGLRAAAFGWLGFALVAAVIAVQIIHSYLFPGPSTPNCHVLGCGGLYMSVISYFVDTAVEISAFGFPAAVVAGGLVGALGAALRAPAPSTATHGL
jgi:hypothetical protein